MPNENEKVTDGSVPPDTLVRELTRGDESPETMDTFRCAVQMIWGSVQNTIESHQNILTSLRKLQTNYNRLTDVVTRMLEQTDQLTGTRTSALDPLDQIQELPPAPTMTSATTKKKSPLSIVNSAKEKSKPSDLNTQNLWKRK